MNEIERRLEALEQSNKKYKTGLTVSLAALSFLLLSGFGQDPPGRQQQSFPRNIVADSITVQTISAYTGTVNNLGSNTLTTQSANIGNAQCDVVNSKTLSSNEIQGSAALFKQVSAGRMAVKAASGADCVNIAGTQSGGTVSVMDSGGKSTVFLSGQDTGGLLQVAGKGGFVAFEAYADEKSGRIRTLNSYGKTLASFGHTDRNDGEIVAHTRNGNRAVVMRSIESGQRGTLIVQEEGGEPLVVVDSDDSGGFLKTFLGKNETARVPTK